MATRLLVLVSAIGLSPAPAWAAEPPTPPPASVMAPAVAPNELTWNHDRGWPAVRVDAGMTVGWGGAQRVAAGSTIGMVWRWPLIDRVIDGVSILFALRWDPPAAGGQSHDHQVTTERMLMFLDPCFHRWQLYACAVVGGGRLGVDWRGWTQGGSHDYNPAIAVTGGRIGVDMPLTSHVDVRLSGELLTLINPVTIPVDDLERWTTPRISGGFELGIYSSLAP